MLETVLVSILRLVIWVIQIYQMTVVVAAVLSWVSPDPYNPIVRFIRQITDPALRPIRNAMAPLTRNWGLDLSPIALILLLSVLESVVHQILWQVRIG